MKTREEAVEAFEDFYAKHYAYFNNPDFFASETITEQMMEQLMEYLLVAFMGGYRKGGKDFRKRLARNGIRTIFYRMKLWNEDRKTPAMMLMFEDFCDKYFKRFLSGPISLKQCLNIAYIKGYSAYGSGVFQNFARETFAEAPNLHSLLLEWEKAMRKEADKAWDEGDEAIKDIEMSETEEETEKDRETGKEKWLTELDYPSSMRKCNTWRFSLMVGTLGVYGKRIQTDGT